VLLGTTSETERKQKVNLMAVNDEIRRLQTLELQTEELKKQLEVFYELAGLSMGGMLPGGAGAFRTDINLDPSDRAQQKIDEYKTKLAELQDPINMAQRGAQGIGDAFSSSFQGIIAGTQTAHCIIQPVIVWHGATPRPCKRWPGIQRSNLHGRRAWS
jgi:hypothetical protein